MTGKTLEIGYLGMGVMGLPMAKRLCADGYKVTVWNRSPGKTDEVAAAGATVAASPADVARASDIVFACVMDTPAVEAVTLGPGGVAEGARPGGIFVDLSTIDPAGTQRMAAALRERCGMAWIDSPVTGGVKGATEGSLVLMAGGDAADIERVRPVAASICRRLEHMGGQGAGQATKLCNQVMVACNIATIAEALSFAARSGVEIERLPDVLEGGFADSTMLQTFGRRMTTRDYASGTSTTLMKDLDLIGTQSRAVSASLPVTGLVRELWRLHVSRGNGAKDAASLIEMHDPPPRT